MAKKNNICVIGAGRFGTAVIEQLVQQDNYVLVVDSNEQNLSKVSKISPLVSTIVMDAADIKSLQSIGIQEIETVIVALTYNIEVVAALLELDVQYIIARAASIRHARVLRQIGVDIIIRPEQESGIRTAIIATNSNFIKFSKSLTEIGDGFVIGSTTHVNEKFSNIPLKDLEFNKLGITIVLVKRNNETFLPSGLLKLMVGDIVTVIGKVKDVTAFFGLINLESGKSKKIKKIKVKRYSNSTKTHTF